MRASRRSRSAVVVCVELAARAGRGESNPDDAVEGQAPRSSSTPPVVRGRLTGEAPRAAQASSELAEPSRRLLRSGLVEWSSLCTFQPPIRVVSARSLQNSGVLICWCDITLGLDLLVPSFTHPQGALLPPTYRPLRIGTLCVRKSGSCSRAGAPAYACQCTFGALARQQK
jgi:hypothetical protein